MVMERMEREGLSGNIESPRYGMQNKGTSNQGQNQNCEDCVGYLNNGMGNRNNAPDDDGDGIPNGRDEDYVYHDCDEECDGTCRYCYPLEDRCWRIVRWN